MEEKGRERQRAIERDTVRGRERGRESAGSVSLPPSARLGSGDLAARCF